MRGRITRRKRNRRWRSRRHRGGSADISEKDAKYVSSRGIMKSCDVIPANITSGSTSISIDIAAIQNGSVIYVHNSAIPDLVKKMDSITKKFILVSGDSDERIPDGIFKSEDDFKKFIEQDKLVHWYAQNAMKDHPKLSRIPIGLEYHVQPDPLAQEKQLMEVRDKAKPLSERELLCYSTFHFSMGSRSLVCDSYQDREDAKAKVPKDLVYYEPSKVSRKDTWTNQTKYAFVLSPHGCGLDCHRTWEALCLGCIPIVKTSGIDPVFDGLPVLIVKDWGDITKDLLKSALDSFGKKKLKTDRLTLAYWMGMIRSKKQSGGRRARYSRRLKRRKTTYKLKGGAKKAIVFMIDDSVGFFAMYTSLFRTYLYAKRQGTPFFIEHDNWHYTYKDGWHDYFKSLTVFNKDEHFDSIERIGINPRNEVMKSFTVADQVEAVKDTFILNDDLQSRVDAYVKDLGEYTSLYVRRGDKVNEMPLVSLDDILAQTTIRDDGRSIFVQTDDYSVVKDMMSKFPSCKIKTLTKEGAGGSNNFDMVKWSPDDRKAHTEELLMSCAITARAKEGWTYYMSNVGHTIKLLGYDVMHVYTDNKAAKEEVEKKYSLDYKEFA